MTPLNGFERWLAETLETIASDMPLSFDVVEIARRARGGQGDEVAVEFGGVVQPRTADRFRADARGLRWALLSGALLLVLAGGWIMGGEAPHSTLQSTPEPTRPAALPTARPYPGTIGYVGLPPVGTEPSSPASGQLVLRYSARLAVHTGTPSTRCCSRVNFSLFADGRAIWELESDLEPGGDWSGLIEQRLTPAGVQLVLDEAASRVPRSADGDIWVGGEFKWGHLTIITDREVLDFTYRHGGSASTTADELESLLVLDEELRDLDAWLPGTAWQDSGLVAFVPSRYSICAVDEVARASRMSDLPSEVRALLGQHGTPVAGAFESDCRSITIAETREFIRIISAAGFRRVGPEPARETYVPATGEQGRFDVWIDPVLPDGTARCRCG